MQLQHPWMDSISHASFGGIWHVAWILMVVGENSIFNTLVEWELTD
jgi:hypothetical protein